MTKRLIGSLILGLMVLAVGCGQVDMSVEEIKDKLNDLRRKSEQEPTLDAKVKMHTKLAPRRIKLYEMLVTKLSDLGKLESYSFLNLLHFW